MAEHNLDEEVIGISMDGVGLGTDGNIWGFEVMKASLEGFERLAHLDYVPQPGGDLATGEPWRMAVSFIEKYAPGQCEYASLPFFQEAGEEKIDLVRRAMKLGINSPLTSSAGRLFDAVAALTGVCTKSSFHAEAPMRLENLVDTGHRDYYEINVGSLIHPGMMIHRILEDLSEKIPVPVISARFHRALVNAIVKSALFSRDHSGLTTVVLSGGVFQNRFLLTNALRELKNFGFRVYTQRLVPSNDGGLALGQLAVAAKYKSQ
jgi:hydrogenase maturation protein HypF